MSIRRQYVETNGSLEIAPPKSRAGARTVASPATLVPELRHHLDAHVGPDHAALVFTGQRGGVLRRGKFRRDCGWVDAAAAIGMPGLHFHDLRHTGNTLAAHAGVSLADLKARMGHDSVRAAMIYQHAAAEADQKIASTLDQRIGSTRDESRADATCHPGTGTQVSMINRDRTSRADARDRGQWHTNGTRGS